MEHSVAKKVAAKLTSEHVTPEPKWKIRLEKVLYGSAIFSLAVISGILLSFVTLYIFQFFTPASFKHGNVFRLPFHFLTYTFPYIWFALSGAAVFLAVYVARKTPKGYRYRIGSLLTVALLIVSFFALIFHLSHVNEKAERFINERAPGGFHSMTEKQWNHPEDGFLGGRVISKEGMSFTIEMHGGETWKVMTSDATVFYGKNDMNIGSLVMISGQKQGNGVFMASTVKITGMPHRMNNKEYHPSRDKER